MSNLQKAFTGPLEWPKVALKFASNEAATCCSAGVMLSIGVQVEPWNWRAARSQTNLALAGQLLICSSRLEFDLKLRQVA